MQLNKEKVKNRLQKVFLFVIIMKRLEKDMKTIANIKSNNYIFNHLIYDNYTDKYFAKHSHALYEIIYILDGEVEYIVEDKRYNAKKHDVILIRPYTYHYFTITSKANYEKIGILFDSNFLKIDPSIIHHSIELLDCENNSILKSIFQKIDYYYKNFPEQIFLELYFSLIKEIVFNLSLIKGPTISPQYHTPILSPVLEYINANLFSITKLEEISQALNISTSYLKSIFKKELKIQPKRYINEKKLLRARQMIWEGEKATIASAKCGFQNYSTFYRLYREYFGISPSDEVATTPLNGN